jgi:hypothetical protein
MLLRNSVLQYFLWIFSVVNYSDFGTYAARGCGALSQYFYEYFNYSFQLRTSRIFNLLFMFHELRCAWHLQCFITCRIYSFNKLVSFSEVYFSNVKFVALLAIYYYYYYYYILSLLLTFGIEPCIFWIEGQCALITLSAGGCDSISTSHTIFHVASGSYSHYDGSRHYPIVVLTWNWGTYS